MWYICLQVFILGKKIPYCLLFLSSNRRLGILANNLYIVFHVRKLCFAVKEKNTFQLANKENTIGQINSFRY
jgi:hypothetical protein